MSHAISAPRLLTLICLVTALACRAARLRAADELSAAANQDERKQQILQSESWRNTMRDLEQWFTVQVIYKKEQVAQMRTELRAKIDTMTADELRQFQTETQEKLTILSSPEAIETARVGGSLPAGRQRQQGRRISSPTPGHRANVSRSNRAGAARQSAPTGRRNCQPPGLRPARNQQVASIRDMQRQQAEAAARAGEAANYSAGRDPSVPTGQSPARDYNPYPGMLGGYRGRWWGPGWGPWGW